MKCRAVILDVYGTLLEIGPPPPEAEALWQSLLKATFEQPLWMDRAAFSTACANVTSRLHAEARQRGIPWPEMLWPEVVAEVLPPFATLAPDTQEAFLLAHTRTVRTVCVSPAAAEILRTLRRRDCTLGIASNAQAYTRLELRDALRPHDLDLGIFEPDLCFWSFEHGFSKPDPHVFQILTTRLAARRIRPAEILMIGDRLDHDVAPAAAYSWMTRHLTPPNDEGWKTLGAWLQTLPAA